MKTFWDERYGSDEYVYGKEPNEFFAEQLKGLDPGMILLPAEGEGRNAVYAAELGWKVHAFDNSSVGAAKALNLAAERNVNILYSITAIEAFEPGNFKYDVIGFFYAHFPPDVRHKFFRLMQDSLKPGGRVILESFHKDQIVHDSGGPKDISMLYSTEELKKDFNKLEFELLSTETVELDEADGHKGIARVVRVIGIRK